MKVAQLVANWIATVNPRVYAVCGAGAMHLNDAICHHPKIQVTAMHHEQAAAFAAEGDARVSGKPGIVHVTAGPGGTNTLTGVACAYVDSIPMIVIAGQVTLSTLHPQGMRQLGMNELDMVALARPITKHAVTLKNPDDVLWQLGQAAYLATSGRKGPVFVEIPLDVQAAEVDEAKQVPFYASPGPVANHSRVARECLAMIAEAERPVMIVGNGVRLAGAVDELRKLTDQLEIPVITSWMASDIMAESAFAIGRCGLFGDKVSNCAVQNADLVLAIGTRLSVGQTGHARHLFAPNAKKIIVDIDRNEMNKPELKITLPIVADAKEFISAMLSCDPKPVYRHLAWMQESAWAVLDNPVMMTAYRTPSQGVNPYYFIEQLGGQLPDDAIVVTDVGFSFLPTMQSLKLRKGQRLFHSGGVSPMGYALPAAIGACRAAPGRKVVCLTGDGGLMMNLQELQTIAHHQLPIAIFVYENGGYHTMRITQETHFGRLAVSDKDSGVSCPDFVRIASVFGIDTGDMSNHPEVSEWLGYLMEQEHPTVSVLHQQRNAIIAPRVQSITEGNKFIPVGLENAA